MYQNWPINMKLTVLRKMTDYQLLKALRAQTLMREPVVNEVPH